MYFKALLFLLFLPTFLFAQQLNWQQLDSLSSVQFESGKYREGLKNTQKCLTLLSSEMALNKQLPILLKEALFIEKLGFYKKADTLIQEVLHQFRANKKTTHPQYPTALNAAGHIQMLLGNYASANRLLLQSKTVLEYKQDTLSDNYVENLIYLGLLSIEQRQLEKALVFYQTAIKNIREESKNHGLINMHIGEYYLEKEDFKKANYYFKLATERIDAYSPLFALLQNHLGRLYHSTSDFEQAEVNFEAALASTKLYFGNAHPYYLRIQYHLGFLYYSLGNSIKAIKILEKIKIIYEENHLEFDPIYPEVLNTLGLLYSERGVKLEETPTLFSTAGLLYNKRGALSKYAIAQFNLGEHYYYYDNDLSRSIPFYQKALSLWKNAQEGEKQTYALFCSGLAKALFLNKQFNKADSMSELSLHIYEESVSVNHPDYVTLKSVNAKIKEQLGEFPTSAKLYLEITNSLIFLLNEYYPTLSEIERLDFLRTLREQFDLIASFLSRHPQVDTSLLVGFQALNMATKGLALEITLQNRTSLHTHNHKETALLFDKYKATRRAIANLQLLPYLKLKNKKQELDSLKSLAMDLDKKISRSTNLTAASDRPIFGFTDLQNQLPPTAATIDIIRYEYNDGLNWTYDYHYLALVTRKEDNFPNLVKLAKEDILSSYLNKAATSENSYVQNHLLNRKVYEALWKPMSTYFKEKASLHISSSGMVSSLAFHALKDEDNSYLNEKYQINYYSNLKSLQKPNFEIQEKKLLLVGDIDYGKSQPSYRKFNLEVTADSTRGTSFTQLKGTVQEIEEIENLFGKMNWIIQKVVDAAAVEEQFVETLESFAPSILHLATHGFFYKQLKHALQNKFKQTGEYRIKSADNPLIRSGLALTNINKVWKSSKPAPTESDGILTSYEIADLNLRQTKLVVLSACDTGLGDFTDGEGIFGLQRAFKAAGVEKLIVSLWKVPDRETQILMQLFYRYFLSGLSPEIALHKAQQEMSKTYGAFYWAAFIVI